MFTLIVSYKSLWISWTHLSTIWKELYLQICKTSPDIPPFLFCLHWLRGEIYSSLDWTFKYTWTLVLNLMLVMNTVLHHCYESLSTLWPRGCVLSPVTCHQVLGLLPTTRQAEACTQVERMQMKNSPIRHSLLRYLYAAIRLD